MAAIDDNLVKFRKLLVKDLQIDEPVVKFITETLALTSLSDFAGAFNQATYQDSCKTDIIDKVDGARDSLVQLSRVRTAWELSRADLDAALKRKSSNSAAEMDEPLDETMRTEINANFEKIYAFKISDELTPSATLMGRLFRELKNGVISVHDLTKVKTAIVNDAIIPKKRKLLGDVLLTMQGEEDDIHSAIGSPLQVILALTTLLNGYALCGTSKVDSKKTAATKVKNAAYGDLQRYLAFVSQQANNHQGPPSKTTAWLLDRDTRTRSAARTLVMEGYPLGEALIDVMERKMAILWEVDGIADVPNSTQRLARSLNYGQDGFPFGPGQFHQDGNFAQRPPPANGAQQYRQPQRNSSASRPRSQSCASHSTTTVAARPSRRTVPRAACTDAATSSQTARSVTPGNTARPLAEFPPPLQLLSRRTVRARGKESTRDSSSTPIACRTWRRPTCR